MYSQSYGFFHMCSHILMWELTVRKIAEKIDAFKLWCWRWILRVPWTVRWSSQSILKEISLEYSLEGLRLMLQYFGHLMGRADSLEKTVMLVRLRAGWEEHDRGWDVWMASPTQWHKFEQTLGDRKGQGGLVRCSPWDSKESDTTYRLKNNRPEKF